MAMRLRQSETTMFIKQHSSHRQLKVELLTEKSILPEKRTCSSVGKVLHHKKGSKYHELVNVKRSKGTRLLDVIPSLKTLEIKAWAFLRASIIDRLRPWPPLNKDLALQLEVESLTSLRLSSEVAEDRGIGFIETKKLSGWVRRGNVETASVV